MVFVIAVGSNQDIEKSKGSLLCLSPLEMVHALVLRVAEVIDCGAGLSEFRKWRKLVLTANFAFEKITNGEDRRWRHEGPLIADSPATGATPCLLKHTHTHRGTPPEFCSRIFAGQLENRIRRHSCPLRGRCSCASRRAPGTLA